MKRVWIAFVAICCMSLIACQKERFVQRIESCADCVSCVKWSWGNGVGYPNGGSCYSSDKGFCKFQVLEDGELRMSYLIEESYGCLSIGGGASFSTDQWSDTYKKFRVSVEKGTEIYIMGYKCRVRNVRIVCHDQTGEDEGDDF